MELVSIWRSNSFAEPLEELAEEEEPAIEGAGEKEGFLSRLAFRMLLRPSSFVEVSRIIAVILPTTSLTSLFAIGAVRAL